MVRKRLRGINFESCQHDLHTLGVFDAIAGLYEGNLIYSTNKNLIQMYAFGLDVCMSSKTPKWTR